MTNYALIKDGIVVNTIFWAGPEESPMDFGPDITYQMIDDGNIVGIGYSFKDGVFSAPAITEEEQAALDEQAVAANMNRKDSLISEVNSTIAVWQTKLLVGRKLTAAETKSLNQWLDYYDLLVAVDANTKDTVSWPSKP